MVTWIDKHLTKVGKYNDQKYCYNKDENNFLSVSHVNDDNSLFQMLRQEKRNTKIYKRLKLIITIKYMTNL